MRGAIPQLPHTSFMAWYIVKHRDKFTFTFNVSLNGVNFVFQIFVSYQ
jgi:hypothetical protein